VSKFELWQDFSANWTAVHIDSSVVECWCLQC